MVRKRSGLSLKVLIFTITAAWTQWSGMQNSVVVPLNMSRLSVAELKQLVARPDVVEMHDVTARDPRFGVLSFF